MNLMIDDLVRLMIAVADSLPTIKAELVANTLSVSKQRDFAELLGELGELLHAHADDQARGIIKQPMPRIAADCLAL